MSITSLYVELIIIGLETVIWILLLIEDVVSGNVVLNAVFDYTKNVGMTILTIGIIYILGCIMDRFSDLVFRKLYNHEKSKVRLEAKSSLIIEETQKQKEFRDYTLMRIRILRSTTINIPFITGTLIWYIYQNTYKFSIVIVVFLLGASLTIISRYGTIDSIRSFFEKTKIIEDYNRSKNTK